jgi:cytochrome c oxidase subunit 1
MGWDLWNLVSSIGAGIIGLSVVAFIVNVRQSLRATRPAGDDPWDARTLEWATSSPPPEYNFAEIPTVHSIDAFWYRKHTRDDHGRLVRIPAGAANGHGHAETAEHGTESDRSHSHGIHMPSPSYYPALTAVGLPMMGFGAIYSHLITAVGAMFLMAGIFGWATEPLAE